MLGIWHRDIIWNCFFEMKSILVFHLWFSRGKLNLFLGWKLTYGKFPYLVTIGKELCFKKKRKKKNLDPKFPLRDVVMVLTSIFHLTFSIIYMWLIIYRLVVWKLFCKYKYNSLCSLSKNIFVLFLFHV